MGGYVPDELMDELQEDKDMWDKLELMPESNPRFDAMRPPEEISLLNKDLLFFCSIKRPANSAGLSV